MASVTGSGAYRPSCLADDGRFRHYYSDDDLDWSGETSALAGLTFHIKSDPAVDASIGSDNPDLAALLAKEGVPLGTIILVSHPTEFSQDDYRDALLLAHLDSLVAAIGAHSIAVEARRTTDGSFVGVGRLTLGNGNHAGLAQSCGVLAIIEIGSNGVLTPRPSCSKPTMQPR